MNNQEKFLKLLEECLKAMRNCCNRELLNYHEGECAGMIILAKLTGIISLEDGDKLYKALQLEFDEILEDFNK